MHRLPPWYTPEMFALDQALKGVWWRCPKHGTTQEAQVMSSAISEPAAYCSDPECLQRVVLVHTSFDLDTKAPCPRYRDRGEGPRAVVAALLGAPLHTMRLADIARSITRSTGRPCARNAALKYLGTLQRNGKVTREDLSGRRLSRGAWRLV